MFEQYKHEKDLEVEDIQRNFQLQVDRLKYQLNKQDHQEKVREAFTLDFDGLDRHKVLHQRLETENVAGLNRIGMNHMVTQITDRNFDAKSWTDNLNH